MGDIDIEGLIAKLDEWAERRNHHDVPGQGEFDIVSLANLLRDTLVALKMLHQEATG